MKNASHSRVYAMNTALTFCLWIQVTHHFSYHLEGSVFKTSYVLYTVVCSPPRKQCCSKNITFSEGQTQGNKKKETLQRCLLTMFRVISISQELNLLICNAECIDHTPFLFGRHCRKHFCLAFFSNGLTYLGDLLH